MPSFGIILIVLKRIHLKVPRSSSYFISKFQLLCVYVCVSVYVHVCGSQWSTLGVFCFWGSCSPLERVSPWGSHLVWTGLPASPRSSVPASAVPVYKHAPSCQLLNGRWGLTSGSHAYVTCTFLIVPSPSLGSHKFLIIDFLRTIKETLACDTVASRSHLYLVARHQPCVLNLHTNSWLTKPSPWSHLPQISTSLLNHLITTTTTGF